MHRYEMRLLQNSSEAKRVEEGSLDSSRIHGSIIDREAAAIVEARAPTKTGKVVCRVVITIEVKPHCKKTKNHGDIILNKLANKCKLKAY